MLDTLILDYNGTIVDDVSVALTTTNHLLERHYGVQPISLERFRDTMTLPWMELLTSNGVLPENINIESHQKAYRAHSLEIYSTQLRLADGAQETINYIKKLGVKLGILSARNVWDLSDELVRLGVHDLFDVIIGEKYLIDDGSKKNKNGHQVIERLGITAPENALMVGDMTADISVARTFGFRSGVVTYGWNSKHRLEAANPDYIFDTFKDILPLFN